MKTSGLVFLAALLVVGSASADEWGTINGQIVVKGDIPKPELLIKKGANVKDKEVCSAQDVPAEDLVIDPESKGLAHCFVYLYKTPDDINDEGVDKTATVFFDQKNCIFKPHAMIVRAGQKVEVLNSDGVAHNTRVNGVSLQENLMVAANTSKGNGVTIQTEDKERVPVEVKCDYHPWMTAYWLVVEHPYAAVTNEKGEFSIKNLPVGEHEFRVWHERVGWVERKYKVKVPAGETSLDPLEVKIGDLEK